MHRRWAGGCPSSTNGGVIKLEYVIPFSGGDECLAVSNVYAGEVYSFKIIHGVGSSGPCDSSQWCIYFHGDFAHHYTPGFGNTVDQIELVGEFRAAVA